MTTRGGIGRIGKAMVYSAIAGLVAGALTALPDGTYEDAQGRRYRVEEIGEAELRQS